MRRSKIKNVPVHLKFAVGNNPGTIIWSSEITVDETNPDGPFDRDETMRKVREMCRVVLLTEKFSGEHGRH